MKLQAIKTKDDYKCELCTELIKKGDNAYVYFTHGINHARARLHEECGDMVLKTIASNPEQALEIMDQELQDYGVDTNLLTVRDVVKKFNTMRYIKDNKQADEKDKAYKKNDDSKLLK